MNFSNKKTKYIIIGIMVLLFVIIILILTINTKPKNKSNSYINMQVSNQEIQNNINNNATVENSEEENVVPKITKTPEEKYVNAIPSKKAELCLERFFEYINNKNYEEAYKYLSDNYKKDEFDSIEKFKDYITSNWYEVNIFSCSSTDKDNGIILLTGKITDKNDEDKYQKKYIQRTFAVRLGSNLNDFVIVGGL